MRLVLRSAVALPVLILWSVSSAHAATSVEHIIADVRAATVRYLCLLYTSPSPRDS